MNDDNLEKIMNDHTAWVFYEDDDLHVYQRCPECGRYVTKGEVLENGLHELKLTGWKCKKHGEIQPFYHRWYI
jgi:uncharacterized OB-fold protein